jgi:hypothetical protein
MGYTLKSDEGYLMPANFGPWKKYDVGHYQEVTRLSVPYVTDKDALASLLPEPFEPADEPVVTVYLQVCRGVDFMAGGGYNLLGVNLSAVFNGKKDRIRGPYSAVLWENDTFPILVGRELLGAPKLYAEIPDPWLDGDRWRFYCSEYGTKLIEGEIVNTSAADESVCRRIEQEARDSRWMCWKYYPKSDWGPADVSYPTAVPSIPSIAQAWIGQGAVRFFETPWEKTPVSAHIMKGLATLAVNDYKPAIIYKGSSELMISETRRIE